MTKEEFDTQFIAAYHTLKRYAKGMVHEDQMDLVHELYCRTIRECEKIPYVNSSWLYMRLRWLSFERYRQSPTYVELSPYELENIVRQEEPHEHSIHSEVLGMAMETWSDRDRDLADQIAYPEQRTKDYNHRAAYRRIRPQIELAFRQADLPYINT